MVMELLTKVTDYIQQLPKKDFEKYLLSILVSIALLLSMIMYAIHQKSTTSAQQIKKLGDLANKSYQLLDDYDAIKQEEDRITTLLDQNKQFDIKIYFEQLCKEQAITPHSWDIKIGTIHPQFDEIVLSATLRNQTMEKLVEILQLLDEKEIIHVKSLAIKPEQPPARAIAVNLSIATIKHK